MSPQFNSIDRMLAVWSERDLGQIRSLLEAAVSPEVAFIDPTTETHGLNEYEANVCDFRTKYPQAVIRHVSGIDSHHNLHRYGWDISAAGKVFLVGFDVAETAEDRRVCRVLGFFGQLPSLS
jgi:hypothetical protein